MRRRQTVEASQAAVVLRGSRGGRRSWRFALAARCNTTRFSDSPRLSTCRPWRFWWVRRPNEICESWASCGRAAGTRASPCRSLPACTVGILLTVTLRPQHHVARMRAEPVIVLHIIIHVVLAAVLCIKWRAGGVEVEDCREAACVVGRKSGCYLLAECADLVTRGDAADSSGVAADEN